VRSLFGGQIPIPSAVVAGTKGKGSIWVVAESVLRHSGLKTALFPSPHLTAPRERIHRNGKSLSEEEEVMASERLEQILKKNDLKIRRSLQSIG
jgi:folylpolyglutamate synthase/dihydropteroate synthase